MFRDRSTARSRTTCAVTALFHRVLAIGPRAAMALSQ
jgi:hypothetical protein